MRPERARILLGALILVLAFPGAGRSQEAVYYFLRVAGATLNSAALNGQSVVAGGDSLFLPLYVSPYLKDGSNELLLEYTSHGTDRLTVMIEARTVGPRVTEVVHFSSAPGETRGQTVNKTISFFAQVPPPAPMLRLTDEDQQAIASLLRAYYDTLARRDTAGIWKFYERALNEDGKIYPEGPAYYRQWVVGLYANLMASPNFRMKPYQPAGLLLNPGPEVVVIDRADHSPVIESEPIDVQAVDAAGRPVTIPISVSPPFVLLKKYYGAWTFTTLPIGF